MTKLHELLASEKTPNSAWNQLYEDTMKKFKNQAHFFEGHTKSLAMIEDSLGNKAIEDQAKEEKPVTTTVYQTLNYALDFFVKAEDVQFQKNLTNCKARGTIYWNGQVLIENVPVDELLGLESRLSKLRQLFQEIPTVDATKYWRHDSQLGCWVSAYPEETTKTEKQIIPVTLKEATKEHPAQVQPVQKDIVVGKFTTVRRSGSATALQKATLLKNLDDLIVEVKKARMRANEVEVENVKIGDLIKNILVKTLEDTNI